MIPINGIQYTDKLFLTLKNLKDILLFLVLDQNKNQ